jgi:hypothetical protein
VRPVPYLPRLFPGDGAQAIAPAESALKIREQIEDPNAPKVREQLAQWREQKQSGG